MAATQQYSLRWNNYFRHLTYALDNHRTNDDFVDVSLCCDGRKIKAHKVVLSSCSSYFKEIFKENPHPHPVIIFKFIKFEDLNSIVEFMYQGEVNVQQEALQSFLQTAELLAVQGLTAEEKEKPKAPPTPIDEHKLIKTIPSTIRAINETATSTQTATQTIEIPTTATILQPTTHTHQLQQQQQQQPQVQQQQPQVQQQQPQVQQQQPQTQQQQPSPVQQHHSVQTQIQHIQLQHQHPSPVQMQPQQTITVSPQQHQQHHHHITTATNTASLPVANTLKKRKITFSDDDDNLYTTETVDYAIKDTSIVKTSEMTFLRSTVKMSDMPEYNMVGDVEDSQQMSDGGGDAPQHSSTQDATSATGGQTVTQYTSEYEILTESEIEEKYNQAEADNAEITIEMGRLLNTASATSSTQATLDETGASGGVLDDAGSKSGNKGSGNTTDMPNNKWTECQFCKMVITTVNLWRHIRTQHTPQPPRKCDYCNKNFKNKYSLREHIRISHEQKIAVKSEN